MNGETDPHTEPIGADGNPSCERWQTVERAAHWAQCPMGPGQMDSVVAPSWYEFAGQEDPHSMDFDSEPWDPTCEAEGTGSRDTGLDFARWNLAAGRYRLVIHPREDGTAFDAFYLAGPGAPPPNALRLILGASTTSCTGGAVAPHGADRATHGSNDANGWGHWSRQDLKVDSSLNAGAGCGHCLFPIAHSECPAPEVLETMKTCDNVELNELCEADGECNTDVHINNCDNAARPPPQAAGSNGP